MDCPGGTGLPADLCGSPASSCQLIVWTLAASSPLSPAPNPLHYRPPHYTGTDLHVQIVLLEPHPLSTGQTIAVVLGASRSFSSSVAIIAGYPHHGLPDTTNIHAVSAAKSFKRHTHTLKFFNSHVVSMTTWVKGYAAAPLIRIHAHVDMHVHACHVAPLSLAPSLYSYSRECILTGWRFC